MSTDPLAGYALIGTMMVDSSEDTAVSSADAATPFELLQGLSYKAKATGLVQVQKLNGGQTRFADAEYVRGAYPRQSDGLYVLGNNWLDGGANGEWGLGLKLNGDPADVAWTPTGYQSSHEYYYDLGVAGVDGPLKAKYFDPTGSYKDEDDQAGGGDDGNVGSFTVEVWQKIDPKVISLDFQKTAVNLVSTDEGAYYDSVEWQDKSGSVDYLKYDKDAEDERDIYAPVVYVRAKVPVVSAKIHLSLPPDAQEPENMIVKGTGPNGMEFSVEQGELDLGDPEQSFSCTNGVVTIRDSANKAFENHVDHFNSFSINWSVSFDDGATYLSAGTTANQVYVALSDPGASVYHTLVHKTTEAAKGKEDAAGVVGEIWSKLFVARSFDRLDGKVMKYGTHADAVPRTSALDLLGSGEAAGECRAWVDLFGISLSIHGINPGNAKKRITSAFNSSNLAGFIVMNDMPAQGTGQNDFQGATEFGNHVVFEYDGKIYDPSYGRMFSSRITWEDAMIKKFRVYNNSTKVWSEPDNTLGVDELNWITEL